MRPRWARAARGALLALLAAAALGEPLAGATPPRPYRGAPYACTEEAQVFHSLKSGDFDFCRLRLRYVPGSRDCLRIVTSTCNVFWQQGSSVQQGRPVETRAERIACPAGPAPPSCPAGYTGAFPQH